MENVKNVTFRPMQQYVEIDQMTSVLQEGGLVLLPADTSWGIACDGTDPVAIIRARKLVSEVPVLPVLLVESVEMLHNWVQRLHPRIETLLNYHQRPLTILYSDPVEAIPDQLLDQLGRVGIRLVLDPFCRQLIARLGKPMLFLPAQAEGQAEPTSFGSIRSDFISGVEFVARHRQKEKDIGDPAVIATLSDEAELVVVEKAPSTKGH